MSKPINIVLVLFVFMFGFASSGYAAGLKDGQHVPGLDQQYNECWNKASSDDIGRKVNCLQEFIGRSMQLGDKQSLKDARLTPHQEVNLLMSGDKMREGRQYLIQMTYDPAFNSPYSTMAMQAVILSSGDILRNFVYLYITGKEPM